MTAESIELLRALSRCRGGGATSVTRRDVAEDLARAGYAKTYSFSRVVRITHEGRAFLAGVDRALEVVS